MDLHEGYDLINLAANQARLAVEQEVKRLAQRQEEEFGGTSGLLHIGTMIGCALAMADAAASLQLDHDADEEEIGRWLSTSLRSFEKWRSQRLADPTGPAPIYEATDAED